MAWNTNYTYKAQNNVSFGIVNATTPALVEAKLIAGLNGAQIAALPPFTQWCCNMLLAAYSFPMKPGTPSAASYTIQGANDGSQTLYSPNAAPAPAAPPPVPILNPGGRNVDGSQGFTGRKRFETDLGV